jgi:5-dehydro-4-deoxyglucarate dehydratase
MSVEELKNRMRGVLGFPATPFRDDLSLDLDALAENVAEMVRYPFCALVAAGGTGEILSLTPQEIEDVVRVTVEAAAGKMPVVGGTAFNAPLGAEIARRLEKAGADCVLALPPCYINAPEEGLFDYYRTIAGATGLPLMLYSRDWAAFTPAQVARLAERVPSLHFWKDGQGDMRKYQRIMQHLGSRLAWLGGLGDDSVPAYFAIGVQGYTSSLSNLAPQIALDLWGAAMAGNLARLTALMQKYVHPLFALRERMRGYEVAVTKQAMEWLGRRAGPVRPPLCKLRAADAEDLRSLVEVYRCPAHSVNPAPDTTVERERGVGE